MYILLLCIIVLYFKCWWKWGMSYSSVYEVYMYCTLNRAYILNYIKYSSVNGVHIMFSWLKDICIYIADILVGYVINYIVYYYINIILSTKWSLIYYRGTVCKLYDLWHIWGIYNFYLMFYSEWYLYRKYISFYSN